LPLDGLRLYLFRHETSPWNRKSGSACSSFLADVLDISEPAAQWLFRAARENFGVEIRQSSLKQSILQAVHCEDNYGLCLKSGSDFEEKSLQVPEDQSEILPGTT
jgi:hypothetical protein